jgi:uncharacterized protein with GYD domain
MTSGVPRSLATSWQPPLAPGPELKPTRVSAILAGETGRLPALGVVVMAKYLVLFGFTAETVKRFIENPSDRTVDIQKQVESFGGRLECYYWMFGQYDGMAIVEMPDSQKSAAAVLAIVASGAFTHFETHELLLANADIANKAREIRYQPPGDRRADRSGGSILSEDPRRPPG